MKCPKCGGDMASETYHDRKSPLGLRFFEGYRCIMCCEILDPVIYRNKYKQKVIYEEPVIEEKELSEKDKHLLSGIPVVEYLEYMEKIGTYKIFFSISERFPILVMFYILSKTTKMYNRDIERCFEKSELALNGQTSRALKEVPRVMKENSDVRKIIIFLIVGARRACRK